MPLPQLFTRFLPLPLIFTSRPATLRLGAGALGLVAVALATGCDQQQPPAAAPPPPEVGVITLSPRSQSISSELPGRTAAFLNAEVRPQVNGIVQKRLFTEGAAVKAGQVLYQIDPSTYRAAVAAAQAALGKAQAAAHTARINAERNAELVKIDAVSRQLAQESQAQAAQAQADVAAAQAALQTAQINLGYTQVKAPIAGRVNLSSVTPGALVTANQATALTTIVQLDPMYVDFTQSTAELLGLRRDIAAGRYQGVSGHTLPVQLVLEDGTPYPHEGQLAFAGLIVNTGTGGVTLRASVPNPDGVLMPGMYVRARLPVGVQPQALLVPQQSVQRDPSGRANVWVVDAQNQVQRRPVTLGQAIGNHWLLEDGLQAGERIVVDGLQRVRPGITVKPVAVALGQAQAASGASAASAAASAAAPPASAPASAPAAAASVATAS